MKKTLAFVLSLIMLLAISSTATASQGINASHDELIGTELFGEMIPAELQRAMEAQDQALNAYAKIVDGFEMNEYGAPVYPDGYGGEFINEENQLVVLVTSAFPTESIKNYQAMEGVIVKEVEYAYNELANMRTYANELIEKGIKVVADGVDVRQNSYIISVEKDALNTLKKDDAFGDRMGKSSSPIQLIEGEPAMAMASLWGGDRLFNESTGSYMTLGIGGSYNGSNAILTCGHGLEGRPYVENYLHRIGRVAYQRANVDQMLYNWYDQNTLGDFAIVNISSNDSITNYVMPGLQITGTYSSLPVGTIIYKYGTSTNYTYGTVSSTSVRIVYDLVDGFGFPTHYYVNGLYQMYMSTDYTVGVAGGDSGGPVWRTQGSSNLLHGIVTAGDRAGRYMYTTPIFYAQDVGFNPKLY